MIKVLKAVRNYYCYCGIEKEEYKAIKKDAYISNYKVWKILHFLMAITFGALFIVSLFNTIMAVNRWFYLGAFVYSLLAIIAFLLLKQDSLVAQLMIYLSMSLLFLFAALISLNKVDQNATTFIVLLVLAPMFMIDKPYFMTIELCTATTIFLIWMHGEKPYNIWQIDVANAVSFTFVGCFLNVISNSLRIKEFVLTRKMSIQKDTDEMTGLMNKGSLTRNINEYLMDATKNQGLLMVLDIDRFKSINDVYGHDIGDSVITQLGHLLLNKFTGNEIVGRFGGDEFIVFIKDNNDVDIAIQIAEDIVSHVSDNVKLPNKHETLSVSIGIAIYNGQEKNYSELFKKADKALYQAKADLENRYRVYDRSL